MAARVLASLGCPNIGDGVMPCLRNATVNQLITIQNALPEMAKPRPPIDGVVVVDHPVARLRQGLYQRMPTIFSDAVNESTVLQYRTYFNATRQDYINFVTANYGAQYISQLDALYPFSQWGDYYHVISALDTDYLYVCTQDNMFQMIDHAARSDVRRWLFMHNPSYAPDFLGAYHTVEESYFFDRGCFAQSFQLPPSCEQNPIPGMPTCEERRLSRNMMELWRQFISTGDPQIGVDWVPYGPQTNYSSLVIDIDPNFRMEQGTNQFRRQACDFWESIWIICGDGRCNPGETPTSCPQDCANPDIVASDFRKRVTSANA